MIILGFGILSKQLLLAKNIPEIFYFPHDQIIQKDTKMMVGLVADTHDRLPMVNKTVRKLNDSKVEVVLHAGDYVAPFVVPRFKELKAKLIGVFGNNDGDRPLLNGMFSKYERFEMRGIFAEIVVDNLRIAMLHGDETELLKTLVNGQSFDVVIHGHTHEVRVFREGRTLVVNPGEVCGYLTGRSTIALLDTSRCDVKIIEL